MKYFLFSLVIMFSFPVLSNDFVGKWTLAGAGCRDQSLSQESHISKSFEEIQLPGLESVILTINSDETTSIIAYFNDDTFSDTGTWTSVGNDLTIVPNGTNTVDDAFSSRLVDGYLVVTDTEVTTSCQAINRQPVVVLGKVE